MNVLRLVRCAYSITPSAPETVARAVAVIAARPGLADRYNCGWAPAYFREPHNTPVVTYSRIDDADVRVCATFQRSWATPLALDFYFEALSEWPERLPELQRPISQPGQHCYTARLTGIGNQTA